MSTKKLIFVPMGTKVPKCPHTLMAALVLWKPSDASSVIKTHQEKTLQ